MALGERLKQLREMRGLSQNELAKRAGIHRPTISQLESGKRSDVTLGIAIKLARGLDVPLSLLAGESELVPA